MRRIKILKATVYPGDEEWCSGPTLINGLTDWEEVDEPTFAKLVEYCHKKKAVDTWHRTESYFFIVEDPGVKVVACIKDFEEMIAKEEAKKRAEARKRKEASDKRKAVKGDKQKVRELKKLKELQEKYSS